MLTWISKNCYYWNVFYFNVFYHIDDFICIPRMWYNYDSISWGKFTFKNRFN